MHVHFLQDLDFEGPANIKDWIIQNGHHLSIAHLYQNETFPMNAILEKRVKYKDSRSERNI